LLSFFTSPPEVQNKPKIVGCRWLALKATLKGCPTESFSLGKKIRKEFLLSPSGNGRKTLAFRRRL